jgi:hypothetical protein
MVSRTDKLWRKPAVALAVLRICGNRVLPYFTEFCTPRIPVPFTKNQCTFMYRTFNNQIIVNLSRQPYGFHQDDHFHT